MNGKRVILMCRETFIEPFEQNGFEVFWTLSLVYPLFYEGKGKVLLDRKDFKMRLDSYKDKISQFKPTYFLAEQWFFTNLFSRLEFISRREMAELWMDFVKDLNKKGIVTIVCCLDDPAVFKRKSDIIPLTHAFQIIVTHTLQMERAYIKNGQKVIYMPNYVTIDRIKKGGKENLSSAGTSGNFKSNFDMFFDGAMNLDRRIFFYRLSKKVSGLDYFFGNKRFYYTSRKKIDFDIANKLHVRRIYRDTSINVLYGAMCDSIFNKCWGVPDRVFNVVYCKGFFLHEYRKHLNGLFSMDPKIYTFKNLNECHQKIRYFLKEASQRKRLSNIFYEEVINRHSVDKRIKKLIEDIESIT